MSTQEKASPVIDHRPRVAQKKRTLMRAKLVEAALRVFSAAGKASPVIDDVIREANVSRGTFYNYFDSLDEVLVAIGQQLNNQMTTDILPVYDVLNEPWKRSAVAFRLFLMRALYDAQWAGFVTRADAWQHHTLVAEYMSKDLENGIATGDFRFERLDAATDFLLGASAHGIQGILLGVEYPDQYMDAYVRMALATLGCSAERCEEGVAFSVSYLQSWLKGELSATLPTWELDMDSEAVQQFLSHSPGVG